MKENCGTCLLKYDCNLLFRERLKRNKTHELKCPQWYPSKEAMIKEKANRVIQRQLDVE